MGLDYKINACIGNKFFGMNVRVSDEELRTQVDVPTMESIKHEMKIAVANYLSGLDLWIENGSPIPIHDPNYIVDSINWKQYMQMIEIEKFITEQSVTSYEETPNEKEAT